MNNAINICRQATPSTFVPPGVQINQLMCSDLPGDQPIVQFINILDTLKMPPGTTVTKKAPKGKLQVKNNFYFLKFVQGITTGLPFGKGMRN